MFKDFDNVFKDFDKVMKEFNDMWTTVSYVMENSIGEAVDVAHDTGDGYTFSVNAAGFKKDELEVTVRGRTTTVKGTSVRTGRKLDTYFTAPKAIDMHRSEAKLEDGILEVKVFKNDTPDGVKVTVG